MNKETDESSISADFEEILGDKAESEEAKVVKVTPQWQKEAQKRSAIRHEEPCISRRFFLIPNKPQKVTAAMEEIEEIIKNGDYYEMRLVFKDVQEIEELEWSSSEDFQ